MHLVVVFLRESVLNQKLLHFDTLIALKLQHVASISGVSDNSTVAAMSLRKMLQQSFQKDAKEISMGAAPF